MFHVFVFFVIHFDKQTTEVNNDTLITKTDRIGKREFRKKKNVSKKDNKCEKLVIIFLNECRSTKLIKKTSMLPIDHKSLNLVLEILFDK